MLHGVLRGELGFRGLIVADAMDMGGVTSLYSPTKPRARAIAGGDVLLMPSNARAALEALEDAVHTARLPESRIDEACRRILGAKAHLGLEERDNQTDLSALSDKLRRRSSSMPRGISPRAASRCCGIRKISFRSMPRNLRACSCWSFLATLTQLRRRIRRGVASRNESLTVLRGDT